LPDKSNERTGGTNASKPRRVGDEIDLFTRQIDGLADTLPIVMRVVETTNQSSQQQYNRFLEQECKIKDSNSESKIYTVEAGKYFQFRRLEGRFQKANLARELVPRTFLASLVSQFDAFMGRLIRQLFNIKPEALDSTASTLSFSQLTAFGSLDSAREFIIDKEIESVLRKSHAEQFDWLENKFGLKLRVDLKVWPVFIEVTERRNLFVHSNGTVSSQYLEVCKRHGSTVDPDLNPGKMLSVSRHYFETAHECLFEIGVKLAQVLWRKLKPDDLELADGNLLSVGYELLEEGRYRLARCLLDFSTETLKRHGKEEHRLSMTINRAQAYKWSGDDVTARKIIGDEDWSATALKFQLAQAVLLDDINRVINIMIKIGANGEIDKTAYREWPLFKELRKVADFSKTFENIFGEPLSRVSLDRKPTSSSAASTIQ
jgi:hypothetical protein